jgi:U2 small nuclear ribonucleoprotein A'
MRLNHTMIGLIKNNQCFLHQKSHLELSPPTSITSPQSFKMRLTAELIQNSLSYLNPLNERELDLRGKSHLPIPTPLAPKIHSPKLPTYPIPTTNPPFPGHKIPILENLGIAHAHDALDLTDNSLTHLPPLPLSPRLRSLLLARNRIASISPAFAASAPNLESLVLTGNKLAQLADLDPLARCSKLTSLVLLDCPVARAPHYRAWVVWRCKSVRFLDFRRVKQAEREQADELFGEDGEETELAQKIAGEKSAVAVGGGGRGAGGDGDGGRVKLSAKERKKVELMIRNAKSLAEIEKLERELNEGRVPGGILDGDDDDDEMEE